MTSRTSFSPNYMTPVMISISSALADSLQLSLAQQVLDRVVVAAVRLPAPGRSNGRLAQRPAATIGVVTIVSTACEERRQQRG